MPKPNKKAKKGPFYQKKWFAIAISAIVVLLLGWFFVIDPILDQKDKERFLRAEAELEEILETKILPVAEPDEMKQEKSCRYSGAKYAEGNLSCQTRIYLAYLGLNQESSIEKLDNISAQIDMPMLGGALQEEVELHNQLFDEYPSVSQSLPNNQDLINCSVNYIHPITQVSGGVIYFNQSSPEDGGLRVTLTCSGSARTEHFPVQ